MTGGNDTDKIESQLRKPSRRPERPATCLRSEGSALARDRAALLLNVESVKIRHNLLTRLVCPQNYVQHTGQNFAIRINGGHEV